MRSPSSDKSGSPHQPSELDGNIRNGIELVSSKPSGAAEVDKDKEKDLDRIEETQKKSKDKKKEKGTLYGVAVMLFSGFIYSWMSVCIAVAHNSYNYGSIESTGIKSVIQVLLVTLSVVSNDIKQNYCKTKKDQSKAAAQTSRSKDGRAVVNDESDDDNEDDEGNQSNDQLNPERGHLKFIREEMTWKIGIYLLALTTFGGIAALLFFLSVSVLPIGDALAIWGLAPIFTAFAAKLFLHEPITRIHFLSLFVAIVGVVCIAQPLIMFGHYSRHFQSQRHSFNLYTYTYIYIYMQRSSAGEQMAGYVCSIIGPLLLAFVFVLFRKLQAVPTAFLTYSQGFGGLICSLIMMGILSERPTPVLSWSQVFVVLGIGVSGFLGNTTMSLAGQLIPSGLSTLINQTEIVWTYLWQVTILHDSTNWITLVGVTAVIAAVVAVSIEQLKDTVSVAGQMQLQRLTNSVKFMKIKSMSSSDLADPNPNPNPRHSDSNDTASVDVEMKRLYSNNSTSFAVSISPQKSKSSKRNGKSNTIDSETHAMLDNDNASTGSSTNDEAL
ncbi:hypothetical protein RFI_25313 [Reticulomyxa filosa]|uniref:EamA domain-containing protein n=1 Tax=Reticulomyxa filosa TaxID=46433 RepID=X6MDG4_RETFI|nr:hypothetical protein RFI_25313 [Reticulomyxa filosa]|eukprot:ETO12063.1 hypothetical protein RFI_25313 [Reticulomyxa filosa]